MDSYPKTVFRVNSSIASNLFAKITDNRQLIDQIIADKSLECQNESGEKIISIFLLLSIIRNKIDKLKGKVLSSQDADDLLQNMILVTSQITYYFIKKAQQTDSFSYDEIYNPSQIIIDYIRGIRDDLSHREYIQELLPSESVINSHYLEIATEYDYVLIEKHLEYLYLLTVLMSIYESPFYDETKKHISQWYLLCFKDLLTDSRIEKICMEPNPLYSEKEEGARNTTKLEIFFTLSNEDKYMIRIDCPHDNVNFIHFNLYEPYKDTAFPLSFDEYAKLYDHYGRMIEGYFYKNGGKMWFRSNFQEMIKQTEGTSPDLYFEINKLFADHLHYKICDNQITVTEMNSFLAELFSALAYFDLSYSNFEKPKFVNERTNMERINLNSYIRIAAHKVDMSSLYRSCSIPFPTPLENELFSTKINLISVLCDYFKAYTPKELSDFDCEELLLLVLDHQSD